MELPAGRLPFTLYGHARRFHGTWQSRASRAHAGVLPASRVRAPARSGVSQPNRSNQPSLTIGSRRTPTS